jgi:type IV pilus assembly protein PilZ
MPAESERVIKRTEQHCPKCREIIPASYAEENPFPEFPCPSCGALIDISSMKENEPTAYNERTDGRLNSSLKVSYDSYNEFITEYTKNVSKGGIFINTRRQHEIREIVDLSLAVPGLDTPLKIKGEVIHIEIHDVSDEDAGIGIKFTDIDPESRKALIEFIKSHDDFK